MIQNQLEICQNKLYPLSDNILHYVPDFKNTFNVCDPIGVGCDVLHDGERDVPIQQVGLVVMINVFP